MAIPFIEDITNGISDLFDGGTLSGEQRVEILSLIEDKLRALILKTRRKASFVADDGKKDWMMRKRFLWKTR